MYYFGKIKSLFNPPPPNLLPAEIVTDKSYHCFFGYYDKCPWDRSGKYLLCLKVPFATRMPGPEDRAEICVIDIDNNHKMTSITQTKAWSWQQGCMLQWLENDSYQNIIYNDFQNNKYISIITDITGQIKKVLPLPIYAVDKQNKQSVSLNFGRLHYASPGYGYVAKSYSELDKLYPEDDGIWYMNLETGKYNLIISLDQIVKFSFKKEFKNAFHYFNHLEFNPSGTRFIFLHRWILKKGREFTRMFTANPDGSEIYCLADSGMVSHFTWKDDKHILAWANQFNSGNHYYLFEDKSKNVNIIGENLLTEDGHPSYSPNGRWLLTDTYPNRERLRTLILFDTLNSKSINIGRYFAPFKFEGPLRCDLHPRWSRDGKKICFDSAHEGVRAIYILNLDDFFSNFHEGNNKR